MAPGVHGSTIVADPDVVAGIDQLEMERLLRTVVIDPRCAIFEVTMLEKNSAL